MSALNKDIGELFKKKDKKPQGIEVGGPVLIDLTPESYIEIIATRRHGKRWIYAVVAVLVGSLFAFAMFYAQYLAVNIQLSSEQDLHQQLDAQIAEYSEVNDVMRERENAESSLQAVASNEIDWSKAYRNIQDALPNDTTISRMAVDVNENPGALVSAAVQIDLTSGSTMSYADALGMVSDLEEVSSVTISGMTRSGEGLYTFSMAFTYDESIHTGRFNMAPTMDDIPVSEEGMTDMDMDMFEDDMMMEEF